MKKKLLLFAILIFLALLTYIPRAYASNYTTVYLNGGTWHKNGNTDWEVAYRFSWYDNNGDKHWTPVWKQWTNKVSGCSGSGVSGTADWCNFLQNASDGYHVYTQSTTPRASQMNGAFRMQWGTTCIDPVENPSNQAYYSDAEEVKRVIIFQVNVTSGRAGADNSGARIGYAYGNVITGRTDLCPFPCPRPSCSGRCGTFKNNCGYGITSASVSCGGCGSAYCGTGSDKCDLLDKSCNSNNYCVVTSRTIDARSSCLNVGGCECTQDSDCSGGSSFCGSGGNVCDRRKNYCNNGRCDIRTADENAPICSDQNGCCNVDSDCNSNQFCKNPPYGVCTTYDRITGRVFVDVADSNGNFNNKWDADRDVGIGNKTVDRRAATSSTWGGNRTTNANGYYAFTDLRNPPLQDLRIRTGQYDTNCTYRSTYRSVYQNVVETTPGYRRDNVKPTPTLGNVNFILRYLSYNVTGNVYMDSDRDGNFSSGDTRYTNTNVIIRTIDSSGNFVGNDHINSNGHYAVPNHVNGQTYTSILNVGTLPNTVHIVRSSAAIDSNRIPGITINCADNGGNHFLVSNGPPVYTPDLTVENIQFPDGDAGTNATVNVRISNEGTGGTGVGFNVSLNNGAGNVVTQSTGGLGAGVTRTLTFTIPRGPNPDTTYTATARVDSTNVIAESDEGNNTLSRPYDTVPAEAPDLVIDSFTVPDGEVDASTNASIIVRNTGSIPTPSGFSVSVDNGTGSIISKGISALGAGLSTTVDVTLSVPGTAGPYTAEATVDSTNLISESNETNNFATTNYDAIYTPPTYEIRGGIFIDGADALNFSDGIKDSTESYTTGTLNVSGVGSFESGANGITATAVEGSYTVSFDAVNDLPAGFEMTYPAGLVPPNPSVQVAVGPAGVSCSPGTHIFASCDAAGNVINVNFGIRQTPAEPWYNGIGGDMRSDPPLVNRIPAASGAYFNESGASPEGAPLLSGIVFGNNLTLNPLNSSTSRITNPNNWLVRNRFASSRINTAYATMISILQKNGIFSNTKSMSNSVNPGSLTGPGIYTSGGNVNMTGGVFELNGGDYVFLVNGNLTIDNEIFVEPGSTAIFVVKGDIIVTSNSSNIQGIFSADNRFRVEGINDGTDTTLTIYGSVIANANKQNPSDIFINERDLFASNEDTPSVQIIYRPDFVLNAPPYIKFSNYTVKEVAPGSK